MKNMVKIIIVLLSVVSIFLLNSCDQDNKDTNNSSEYASNIFATCESSEITSKDSLIMPAIVFYCISDYKGVFPDENNTKIFRFIDKNGDCYYIDAPIINNLSSPELYEKYINGDLKDYLIFKGNYDINKLCDRYEKLLKVSKNTNYEIRIDDDKNLDVETEIIFWAGFYLDESDNLKVIELQRYDNNGKHFSNDSVANELAKWLEFEFDSMEN